MMWAAVPDGVAGRGSSRGERRTTVEEYCVSEGWIKVSAGKSLDRKGRPMQLTLKGEVEAWFEDLGDDAPKLTA